MRNSGPPSNRGSYFNPQAEENIRKWQVEQAARDRRPMPGVSSRPAEASAPVPVESGDQDVRASEDDELGDTQVTDIPMLLAQNMNRVEEHPVPVLVPPASDKNAIKGGADQAKTTK